MNHPWRLLELTPREIEWEVKALAGERETAARRADLAAWLAGRYVLMAVHAPKKFPRSPDGIRLPPAEMTGAQMKQVFKNIAAKRGETDGNC